MKTSESIKNLSKALLAAQKAMGGAVKGAKNPFFKSSYSDYNSVLEVVKEPLNDAGVLVLQPTSVREGKTVIETTLLHADSGEYISGDMEVVCAKQNDPQAYGSAVTYARRYALQAMLSIPSVDDDSESAMTRAPKASASVVSIAPKPLAAPVAAVAASVAVVASTEPVPVSVPKKSSFKAAAKAEPVAASAPAAKVASNDNMNW